MKWTAVDLFCGSGAVTEGLKQSSFRVVAAIDNDSVACKTYRENHPDVALYENDIRKVPAKRIVENQLNGQKLDLLVVCAPCQPFSSQNRGRSPNDRRARLVLEAIRFVRVLKPEVIFFENVPGITAAPNAGLLNQLTTQLVKLHYKLGKSKSVDVSDYGVPQRRRRCIMFAVRLDRELPNIVDIASNYKGSTVRKAIGDLPSLRSGESDPSDKLHRARKHLPIALERMAHIPKDGGSRSALPYNLVLNCHKNADDNCYPDVYGRMSWNSVAPTLTTGCTDITRGRFMHPRDDRAITLREAARLQTFPDNYVFSGTASDISSQIGNAVPSKFVTAIMPAVKAELAKGEEHIVDQGG